MSNYNANINTNGASRRLPFPVAYFDDRNISRLEPVFPTYIGSVITVGSTGDYTNLTDAITNVSNGGVIEIIENLNLDDESSGYGLINDLFAKDFMIKGANENITLTCTNSDYGIRCLRHGKITIKDLKITASPSSAGGGALFAKTANVGGEIYIDNIHLTNNNSISVGLYPNGSDKKNNIYVKDSIIEADGRAVYMRGSIDENQIFYFKDCQIRTKSLYNGKTIDFVDLNGGSLYMYNCVSFTGGRDKILNIGENNDQPVNTNLNADIRDCSFSYDTSIMTSTLTGHNVLIGRGTNNIKFLNNIAETFSVDSSEAMGLVLKTTPASGTALIKGNTVTAHLPLRIKGGRDLDIQNNHFISNFLDDYGMYISNIELELTEYNCDNITFRNNYLKGGVNAIQLASSTSETAKETSVSWDFDKNYYYASSKYLADLDNVQQYTFQQRGDFWDKDRLSVWRNVAV